MLKKKWRNSVDTNVGSGDDLHENLGLDADGSSEDTGVYSNLNSDNDRISGNPDGEDDQKDTKERPGHSSLTDK